MNKVKLTCNWCSDQELYDRFSRCYISKYNLNENVQFVNGVSYDWLVIINHPRFNVNFPKEKTLGVIMEPSWTEHYQQRHILERYCNHIFFHKEINNPQYIYYPGLLPYHVDIEYGENIDFYLNYSPRKTKKCSMVVSYTENSNDSLTLYKKRTDFAATILQSQLDVDIYGNGWNLSGIQDKRLKGHIQNKRNALEDYEFSIAIENCVETGYFSEKLTDCILLDCTPIYYGCPNIEGFLHNVHALNNLNDITELSRILQTNPLNQDKKLLATRYNLYKAITKYINTVL